MNIFLLLYTYKSELSKPCKYEFTHANMFFFTPVYDSYFLKLFNMFEFGFYAPLSEVY